LFVRDANVSSVLQDTIVYSCNSGCVTRRPLARRVISAVSAA